MAKLRPRIALLTALLLITIASMAIVIAQLWREVWPLRKEVRMLRDETGRLSVEDESKLHAIEVRTNENLTWKWRFWIPERANVSLKFFWGNIPLQGYPTPTVTKPELRAGEQWVTLSVQQLPTNDAWQCEIECSHTSDTMLPISEADRWFLQSKGGFMGEGVGTMSIVDDENDGEKTFLLQRYRV